MNIIRILMTAAWLVSASHAMADSFTIADFSIVPGETKTISVELNYTDKEYIAFEFYLSLPDGISISKNESNKLMAELNSERIVDHNLKVRELEDGTYYFFCFSQNKKSFIGNSGEILTITITAAETADPAPDLEGRLFDTILIDSDKEEWDLDDTTFKICVGTPEGYCPHGYMIGDINNDGTIDITDVIQLVNIVINDESSSEQGICPQGCIWGDLNNDEKTTVTDVMQLVEIVFPN